MAAELKSYIAKAREKKLSDEQIKNSLTAAGWQEEQIAEALTQDPDLPVPPPPPSVAHVGMWVGFLYILFFISLYVLATAISGLLNLWVEKAIPTVINSANSSSGDFFSLLVNAYDTPSVIRGYIAAIIVSFPILCHLPSLLKNNWQRSPLSKISARAKFLSILPLWAPFLFSWETSSQPVMIFFQVPLQAMAWAIWA